LTRIEANNAGAYFITPYGPSMKRKKRDSCQLFHSKLDRNTKHSQMRQTNLSIVNMRQFFTKGKVLLSLPLNCTMN